MKKKTNLAHFPEYPSKNPEGLGIQAGITKVFQMGPELQLWNSLQLTINKKQVSKTVEKWIEEDPQSLYRGIFIEKKAYLSKSAYKRFYTVLKEHHLDLFAKIEQVKQKREAKRKAIRSFRKDSI